jgi:adenine-specific DNA-methyltransferase
LNSGRVVFVSEKVKLQGRVYTPEHIVKNILDSVEYSGPAILEKHIIDNSCGDGAFLTQIVDRYCNVFLQASSDKNKLKHDLETYIHGIEIDKNESELSKNNLDNIAFWFGLEGVNWDVRCQNTLEVDDFDGKMDFVVGNPPYVRVHNLKESFEAVKEYKFAQNGMTDLFIVFFEIGFRMLNEKGKLGYISPSSFLNSTAGKELRGYIKNERTLSTLIDLGHYQPFKATTYTLISVFENGTKNETINYCGYNEVTLSPEFVSTLSYEDVFVNDSIMLGKKEDIDAYKKIIAFDLEKTDSKIFVKNGFATLADKVFIGDFGFTELTIPILKGSTGKWSRCIYPYDELGDPLPLKTIKESHEAFSHLEKNKDTIIDRALDMSGRWYAFGRSQALRDVSKDKISINTLIKTTDNLKLVPVPAGSGIYSGLYILSPYSIEEIDAVLRTEEFVEYLKLLKNYKSGGYYTYSSKDLLRYLKYKLEG